MLETITLPELLRRHIQSRVRAHPDDLQALARELTLQIVPKHGVLSIAGEVCQSLYFVERGCLRLFAASAGGNNPVIRFAAEGWWISDFESYFTGEPSRFAVDALEESRIYVLRRDREQRLDVDHPVLARYFLTVLERLTVGTHRRLIGMLTGSVEDRYAEFLRLYESIAKRLPQHQIAAYLGVTPEAWSRIRTRMSIRG